MKLPIKLGNKWIVIIAIIVTTAVVLPSTAFITSKVNKKKYDLGMTILQDQIKEWKSIVSEAMKLPKYNISNTFTIEKNKKGQMVFVPTNNVEITELLKSIETKMTNLESDSTSTIGNKGKSFWQKLKFWED